MKTKKRGESTTLIAQSAHWHVSATSVLTVNTAGSQLFYRLSTRQIAYNQTLFENQIRKSD